MISKSNMTRIDRFPMREIMEEVLPKLKRWR